MMWGFTIQQVFGNVFTKGVHALHLKQSISAVFCYGFWCWVTVWRKVWLWCCWVCGWWYLVWSVCSSWYEKPVHQLLRLYSMFMGILEGETNLERQSAALFLAPDIHSKVML